MSPDELSAAWRALWQPGFGNLPKYNGVMCQQFQSDLDMYEQVVERLIPPFILATGVYWGGTTALLADTLARVNPDGVVIAVDIDWHNCQVDFADNVVCLNGDAASPQIVDEVKRIADGRRGLVQLDDDHSSSQVLKELELYAGMADVLVVEDTIMEFLGEYDDGPHLALKQWLPDHSEFVAMKDPAPTQHVGGWLSRINSV